MFPPHDISRRQALALLVRMMTLAAVARGPSLLAAADEKGVRRHSFNVLNFGAIGDGVVLDTRAIQQAIDEAATVNGRVIVPGGKRFKVGTLVLKSGIEFHLETGSILRASTEPDDYAQSAAILTALQADGLVISGKGVIDGHARDFMTHYDEQEEWWQPKAFRPRLAALEGCRDLVVRDITFYEAPEWTLHLVGCERVLVDGITVNNLMDVPNCDGIDPDHCRDVEIKNCRIRCGDDAIVVKTSRQHMAYGESARIHVHDCVLETQDSGVKIGTETTQTIRKVVFERCEIRSSARGLAIQLRDEGDVRDIDFRDITFLSRYHSDPWWGRGEAISFTAIPRKPGVKVGRISRVQVKNVKGRAENSIRISGCAESRIKDVTLTNVDVVFDRWTKYRGGLWDNRPTTASVYSAIEEHGNPAIHVRFADDVVLRDCAVSWGKTPPDSFTHALEAHDVTELDYAGLRGEAAHPKRDAAVSMK